jgi:hypothetical protein
MPAHYTSRKRSLYRVVKAIPALIIGATGVHRPNVRGLAVEVSLIRRASVIMLGKCQAYKVVFRILISVFVEKLRNLITKNWRLDLNFRFLDHCLTYNFEFSHFSLILPPI